MRTLSSLLHLISGIVTDEGISECITSEFKLSQGMVIKRFFYDSVLFELKEIKVFRYIIVQGEYVSIMITKDYRIFTICQASF